MFSFKSFKSVLTFALTAACATLASAQVTRVTQAEVAVSGTTEVSKVFGVGSQIYQCTDGQWKFYGPTALLFKTSANVAEGKPNSPSPLAGTTLVGHHFRTSNAIPGWTIDGITVSAKPTMAAPGGVGNIDWLVLKTVDDPYAKYILRTDTSGGTMAGICPKEGAFISVPYQTTYVFLK